MCGIFGIVRFDGRPLDGPAIACAVRTLRHRGPDDEGYLLAETQTGRAVAYRGADTHPSLDLPRIESLAGEPFDAALGFRRLSILDLSPAGHQPMSTADGRYHLVFNGEIYNYLELRAELEALGCAFRSRSDTEVLLAAYAQWGAEALNRLVGMFAFGVLDLQRRTLFLARDFFGIKPLYYWIRPDALAFASEIKALLELPGVRRRVNPQRLYDYLRFGVTCYGEETLLAGVLRLPAAHYLEIPLDRPYEASPVRYWAPDLGRRADLSFEEAAAGLRDLFMENVRLHLRSDVPVGVALSGGIDSSAIVRAMRHLRGDDRPTHVFSYIADDPGLSEEPWIDRINRAGGTQPHKVYLDPQSLVDDLDHLIYVQEEPFGSTSIYAQHRIFRLAHEAGIKVVLDGQGADELLGGYRFFLGARMASLLRQGHLTQAARFLNHVRRLPHAGAMNLLFYTMVFMVPPGLRMPLMRLAGEDPVPRWLNAPWFAVRGVSTSAILPYADCRGLHEQLAWSLSEVGLPDLLRYEDCNSMAFSIESRVPFLTPAMADFVFALPEAYLISTDGTTKSVFRQAMRGLVPDEILDRRDKIGFVTTEHQWLAKLGPWVDETLRTGGTAVPALNVEVAAGEWNALLNNRKRFDFRVWRWINLIRWARRFNVSFAD